jgi:hypothetical protein
MLTKISCWPAGQLWAQELKPTILADKTMRWMPRKVSEKLFQN